jgi:hypothetical protein
MATACKVQQRAWPLVRRYQLQIDATMDRRGGARIRWQNAHAHVLVAARAVRQIVCQKPDAV